MHLLQSLAALDWVLIALLAYLVWAIAVCVGLVMARRSPVATVGWLVTLLFLPYVGALIYLFFGPRRLRRRRLRYAEARALIGRAAAKLEAAEPRESIGEEVRLRYRQLAGLAVKLHQSPPLAADAIEIFVAGDPCYDAIIGAVAQARRHVHVEYYIWDPGRTGDRLRDALVERARAGVAVKVLVDDVGARDANAAYFAPLLEAGGLVAWFNPVRLSRFRPTLLNFRTHRKIVMIDGRVAFTGGMNVSDNHSSGASRSKAWRDTHLRIDGPPVAALQRIFLEDWQFAYGTCEVAAEHFAAIAPQAIAKTDHRGPSVQIIASGPDETVFPIQMFMFAAIATARHSLAITTPYFIPDEPMLAALKAAALRGVECRILVPKVGDSKLVSAAAKSYFDELVRSGIAIHEYGPPMLHAKTMVIDHAVAVVGTANLDNRSFRLNFEVMAVIYDELVAQDLAGIFEADLAGAREYRPRRRRESALDRFLFGLARLFSPLL